MLINSLTILNVHNNCCRQRFSEYLIFPDTELPYDDVGYCYIELSDVEVSWGLNIFVAAIPSSLGLGVLAFGLPAITHTPGIICSIYLQYIPVEEANCFRVYLFWFGFIITTYVHPAAGMRAIAPPLRRDPTRPPHTKAPSQYKDRLSRYGDFHDKIRSWESLYW